MTRNRFPRLALLIVLGTVVGLAQAVPIPATLVLKEGDLIDGATVSGLNAPFTDGNGKVGFVGQLDDGQRFIWWDAGPVFLSGWETGYTLTGGESTMGVSNTGGFIYSPSADGNDAVYTHGGVLLKKTDYIPSLGVWSSFNSRPTMLPDGTAYWIAGTTDTEGGSTTNRHLFRASDPTDPGTITRILGGGDVIEGKTVKTTASNFPYWISDNGAHHIHRLDMETGSSSNDTHIYVDGAFVAQEATPTGQDDNWDNFDLVCINNLGNYVFSGDTDGSTSADEFVAYNGQIAVREGSVLDGVTLGPGWSVNGLSLNDLDQVVQLWGTTGDEHLFFGHASDLAASIQLLATGDQIDIDGDGMADYTITDFNASPAIGPGLDLAEDGMIYVEVDMESVTLRQEVEAVIGIAIPEPASLALLALGGLLLFCRR